MRSQNNFPKQDISFSFSRIENIRNTIIKHNENWDHFFQKNEITPLVLYYEDMVKNLRASILVILSYLDIQLPSDFKITKSNYKKQSDFQNKVWYHKYLAIQNKSRFHHVMAQSFTLLHWISNIFQTK